MSPVYDNWGRLVSAVIRKQQLWELFHEQSMSLSISTVSSDSSFSFHLNSSLDDAFFTSASSNCFGSNQKEYSASGMDFVSGLGDASHPDVTLGPKIDAGSPSSMWVKNQCPVVSENLSSNGNVSSLSRRKRNLNIEVPKFQFHNQGDFLHSPSSSETYPNPSPRLHTGYGERHSESPCNWPNYAKQQGYPLPLPPTSTSNSPPASSNSIIVARSSLPLSPGRKQSLVTSGSHWKKGKLIGEGEYGNIYIAFNSETGEMCAMKEVSFFSDDAKSTQTFKQLEIRLLSSLKHPNIVRYHCSELVDNKFYMYLEYVSGGSVYKILKQYGKLRESAVRSYTQQILAGLAYLHSKDTVHRNIKGANILVDPSGCVKLADFGMVKHGNQIVWQSTPLSDMDNLYWMAPEVIRDSNVCNKAVDIWSLGCTVMEMATSKPPWSQYIEAVAMFKIMNCKELPVIPDYLSDECKDFVRRCLQWNPFKRPTAAQLLEHPFVRNSSVSLGNKGIDGVRSPRQTDPASLVMPSSAVAEPIFNPRNFLQHPRSPQQSIGTLRSSPKSILDASSGSSTPVTGGTSGTILYQRFNQVTLQESKCLSSPSYWAPIILQRTQPVSYAFTESDFRTRNALEKQFERVLPMEKFKMDS